jgi:hypothetical protein
VTKALICLACVDIVTPYTSTDRGWRRCRCGQSAVRWRNPDQGLIDVTATAGPRLVRVLGLNNLFLQDAVTATTGLGARPPGYWRGLHQQQTTTVPRNYLFHADQRNCWAVVIAVGDTNDVSFVEPGEATKPAPEETHTP